MSTDIAESLPKRKFAPAPMVAKGAKGKEKSAPPAATGGSGTFKKGDLIKFSNHTKVYQLSADTTSDGSTAFTINIYPTLQTAVSNTTTVTYNNVPMTVALIDDDPDFETNEDGVYEYGIDVREEY